jgi:hypothetical protein
VDENGCSTVVTDTEETYIKSRSISAQNMDLNGSGTTGAKKDKKTVG